MTKHFVQKNLVFGLGMLTLISVCLPHSAWAAVAGRFQFVTGDVSIVGTDGTKRQAIKGGEINEQESIISGTAGSAQLRMIDNGIIAVRPETTLRIDEYKFTGKEDGKERGFFSLLKGGFRSITGLIGRMNKDNYSIRTPAATIGIRGTDHETIHLTAALPNLPEGTYNKVNTGATVINGTLVGVNQAAYAPNLGTPAAILPQIPTIFEAPKGNPPGQGEKKPQSDGGKPDGKPQEKGDKRQEPRQKPAGSNTQPTPGEKGQPPVNGQPMPPPAPPADGTPPPVNAGTQPPPPGSGALPPPPPPGGATLLPPPPPGGATLLPPPPPPANLIGNNLLPPPPPPTQNLVTGTTGSTALTSGSGTILAPIGTGAVGGDISMRNIFNGTTNITAPVAGGGNLVVEGPDQTIMLDSNTRFPVLIAEQGTHGNMKYSSGTAQKVDAGHMLIGSAMVKWGRYVGPDQFIDSQGTRDPFTMSLIFTEQAMKFLEAKSYFQSNSHNFSFVPGAGSIVDNTGSIYAATGNLSVTGTTSPFVSLTINANNAAKTWNLVYSGTLQQFYKNNCTTGPCGLPLTTASLTGASSINGDAGGIFIGPNAAGAITTYSANAYDASGVFIGALQGTSVFKR